MSLSNVFKLDFYKDVLFDKLFITISNQLDRKTKRYKTFTLFYLKIKWNFPEK